MKMTSKPLIQDLVKEAMATDAQRAKIAAEGARQMNLADDSTKEASASGDPESVSTDYAMKLASAVEYATPFIVKAAEVAPPEGVSQSNQTGSMPGPGGQGKGHAQPPTNPGMQAAVAGAATQMANDHARAPGGPGTQTTAMSGGKGKVAAAVAKLEKDAFAVTDAGHEFDAAVYDSNSEAAGRRREARATYGKARPGLQGAATVGEAFGSVAAPAQAISQLGGIGTGHLSELADMLKERHNAYAAQQHAGGSNAWNPLGGVLTPTAREQAAKQAAAPTTLVDAFLATVKQAEDSINPARISAGAAVPPETSASGEAGGNPVAGAPQGPSSLVGSNESATNYKKNQAYAPRKAELKQYFNEPALTSQTDTTLQQAFAHTGEAGTKLAGAEGQVKTAAARALLSKLAEQTAGKAG